MDVKGAFLFAVNTFTQDVSALSIAADGVLTPIAGSPFPLTGAHGNPTGIVFVGTESDNQSPVAQCQDVIVPTDPGVCTANASVDGNSFDPDADALTLVQSPASPYDLGSVDVTLTVTDSGSLSDACTATVSVVERTPCRLVPGSTGIRVHAA